MKKSLAILAALLTAGLAAGEADAGLVDIGGGMIYDTDRNITWASDVSLFTTMYDAALAAHRDLVAEIIAAVPTVTENGRSHTVTTDDFRNFTGVRGTWWGDMAFAQSLKLGGYDDWRLPTVVQPEDSPFCLTPIGGPATGFCRNSELGHLFYDELGATPGIEIAASHNVNYALFENVTSDDTFWTGTNYDLDTISGRVDYAYLQRTDGYQDVSYNLDTFATAWVVRDGGGVPADQPVGGAVPEPVVVSLLFAGMGAIGIASRRRLRPVAARKDPR